MAPWLVGRSRRRNADAQGARATGCLFLNGFDRLAYPNEVEGGKKIFDTTPSTFWDHLVHGPWGVDQDAFSMMPAP